LKQFLTETFDVKYMHNRCHLWLPNTDGSN